MTHLTKERLEAALNIDVEHRHWTEHQAVHQAARAHLKTLIDAKTAPTGWNFNMDDAPRDEGLFLTNGKHVYRGYWEDNCGLREGHWTNGEETEYGESVHKLEGIIAWKTQDLLPTPPEKSE